MSVLSAVSSLGFCCSLCHHSSVSPGHPLQLLLLSNLPPKGAKPPRPDFWGSEPAAYPTMSCVLCFSMQGLCSGFSACMCAGATAGPHGAAVLLLLAAGRRRDLEVGTSRAGLCCVGITICGLPQNIFRVISSCFAGSLLIFHWDAGAACKACASKEGGFQQLWG